MLSILFKKLVAIFLVFTYLFGDSPSFAVTKEALLQSITDAEDFSHYSARPVQTASREEAFEALKDHLQAMGSYHQDMATMYEDHYTRYSQVENQGMQKKLFNNFLKNVLGFEIPKNTSSRDCMTDLIDLHKKYSGTWFKKLSGLTGEIMIINGEIGRSESVLEPTLESSQRIVKKFEENFNGLSPQLDELKNDPEKCIHNKVVLMAIDELWALRHGHALILPWAKSDEEIKQEQAALKKRERNRLKKQRLKANQKRRKAENTTELEGLSETITTQEVASPPSNTTTSVSLPDEVNQENNETSTVHVSLNTEEAEEDVTQPAEDFDYEAFVQEERQKSFEKRQQVIEEQATVAPQMPPEIKYFQVDEDSYNSLMDLFEHKNIAFNRFVKAFENGLHGKMYKNKGGSIRAFQLGKYSFNLHKPHGKKGMAMFYDELRQRAIKQMWLC